MKPGTKTSEFMLGVGALLIIVFNDKIGLNLGSTQLDYLTWIAMTYIGGRSAVKALPGILGSKADA